MTVQNLIIYKFNSLYQILEELDLNLNFKIIFADNENSLNDIVKNLNNYLIISNKKDFNFINHLVVDLYHTSREVHFYALDGNSYSNSFQAEINYDLNRRVKRLILMFL